MSCRNNSKFYLDVPVLNFKVKRGDTWTEPTIQWQDSNHVGIQLVTLSYTARLKIFDEVDGTELVSLSTGAGTIVLDDDGFITFLVPATTTANYTWEEGVYDLEMTSGAGVVTTLVRGRVQLLEDVTV